MNKSFLLAVRQGEIPGYSIVHKFGRNASVTNNVWSMISLSNTAGSFPVSGSPVNIKAGGDVGDIFGGSGAREITVIGINTDLIEVSENIVTSGAGASLPTTNSFWRVYRTYVANVGTYGGNNLDDIVIENSIDMITIKANEGQSQHGSFSIPTGKTGYLLHMNISVDSNKAANIRTFIRPNFTDIVAPFSPAKIQHSWDGVLGEVNHNTEGAELVLNALTDIWVEAQGGGQNTEVSVDFEILLVDDDPGHIKRV